MMAFMPVAGRLYDLLGPRIPAVVGLIIATYGTCVAVRRSTVDMSDGRRSWLLDQHPGRRQRASP